jgi:hypothetical protein
MDMPSIGVRESRLTIDIHDEIDLSQLKLESQIGTGAFGVIYKGKYQHHPVGGGCLLMMMIVMLMLMLLMMMMLLLLPLLLLLLLRLLLLCLSVITLRSFRVHTLLMLPLALLFFAPPPPHHLPAPTPYPVVGRSVGLSVAIVCSFQVAIKQLVNTPDLEDSDTWQEFTQEVQRIANKPGVLLHKTIAVGRKY